MKKRYISQTEAAKMWGVDRATVRKNLGRGKCLAAVVKKINGRQYVDIEHPDAIEYGKSHSPTDVTTETGLAPEVESEVRKYWDWTLSDIIAKCGTMAIFKDLVTAADKIEGIHAKRLAADKSTGELIAREYVRKHVLGLIEAVTQRLLTESPVKIAFEAHGRCQTGATVEQVQEIVQAAISRELKTAKRDVTKALKNASK